MYRFEIGTYQLTLGLKLTGQTRCIRNGCALPKEHTKLVARIGSVFEIEIIVTVQYPIKW